MRWTEVPDQLLNPGMRGWVCNYGGIHFAISHEDGTHLKPEDRAAWVGYTASYKRQPTDPVTRIDGLWQSFSAAEAACKAAYKQLKRPS